MTEDDVKKPRISLSLTQSIASLPLGLQHPIALYANPRLDPYLAAELAAKASQFQLVATELRRQLKVAVRVLYDCAHSILKNHYSIGPEGYYVHRSQKFKNPFYFSRESRKDELYSPCYGYGGSAQAGHTHPPYFRNLIFLAQSNIDYASDVSRWANRPHREGSYAFRRRGEDRCEGVAVSNWPTQHDKRSGIRGSYAYRFHKKALWAKTRRLQHLEELLHQKDYYIEISDSE
jgi:hypothetical protein